MLGPPMLARHGPIAGRRRDAAQAFEFKDRCRLRTVKNAQGTLRRLVETFSGAVFLIDAVGRILLKNSRAETLLRDGAVARRDRSGQLVFCRADTHLAFRRALGQIDEFANMRASRTFAVEADGQDRVPAFVAALPSLPRSAASVESRKSVIVVLPEPRLAPETAEEMLMSVYRLTYAEARLATSLVSGSSLALAAAKLGVTTKTARNQLAAAMAKLNVSRQAELVSKIFALVPRVTL